MSIELKKTSNGIHEYVSIIVKDINLDDLDFLKKIVKIKDDYNTEQIGNA